MRSLMFFRSGLAGLVASLLAAQLLLIPTALAADANAEIKTVVQAFNDQIFIDPLKSMSLLGYPFLMDNKVYLFAYEVERDLGKPVPLEDFLRIHAQVVKIEVFQPDKTPAADAVYLKSVKDYIKYLNWQDAVLAKVTMHYQDAGKGHDAQNYFLLRRSGTQWKIYGGVMATEMQEEGG